MYFRRFCWVACISAFLCVGCEELEVKNLNNPDFNTSLTSPGKVEEVAGELIHGWFMATHGYNGPASVLLVAADAATCSWSQAT